MQYREIADRLAEDIRKNHDPGERLPGVRDLARKEGISLVTARNVYQALKEKGLITVRQGSGTYVMPLKAKGYIDMASIAPPDEMLLWMMQYLSLPFEGLTEYDAPQGYEPLRERAGESLKASGIRALPLVTSGSQQALFLTGLSLLKPGDTVAVEDPCYRGAIRLFESLQAKILIIPHLSSDRALEELKKARIKLLYTMPQGHFPTGLSMPDDLKEGLLDLAEKKGFYIIEDDPVSELMGMQPLKAKDVSDRVIYAKSLSNILGPGLRIGFSVFPEALLDQVVRLKEINDLSISSMVQRMLHTIMCSPGFSLHLSRMGAELRNRQKILRDQHALSSQGLCLWLKTGMPARILVERLLNEGIRITPGDIYGPAWADHIRISLLRPSAVEFPDALNRIFTSMAGNNDPRLINLL